MNHIINAAIQVIPKSNTKDIYAIVDKAIEAIDQSGLKYEVTPLETVIEGPYDQVMDTMKQAQEAAFNHGADEILVNIKLQVRKNGDVTFEEKVAKYRK